MGDGVFVTATDTGVGKTVVSTGLVRAWRARGIDAVGYKPVETGVPDPLPDPDGPAATDAQQLWQASGATEPLAAIGPITYPMPAAPEVAAHAIGRPVDRDAMIAGYRRLADSHERVVVEGAGGLSVTFAPNYDMADLAADLSLPVVIVCRPNLGTLNHTFLTVHYARAKGLRILGLIISGMPTSPDALGADPSLATNEASLADRCACPILATLPQYEPGQTPPDALGTAADAISELL